MRISAVTQLADLTPHLARWNELAGNNTFLRWEWLGAWWDHYGAQPDQQLLVLIARNEADEPIGFVPWYLNTKTSTIEFLGSGKACTDYLTVLCAPEHQSEVVRATVDWLRSDHASEGSQTVWHQVELIGGMTDDAGLRELKLACAAADLAVHQRPCVSAYCRELPPTWEEFMEQMSKTARRTIRKTLEELESLPQKNIRVATTPDEIRAAWHLLVDLHQRRRQSLGETGCFDYPPFGEFLLQATLALAEQQLAELVILETEGRPVAIQHVIKSETTYATYQSGIDPDRSDISPGRLLVAHCIRQSVERGYREFDFLRGDEEYKIRWRGTERPMSEVRIIAPTVSAKLRHQVWLTGSRVKSWIKSYQN